MGEMRICCDCKTEYPLTDEYFYYNSTKRRGFVKRCKTCSKARFRDYYYKSGIYETNKDRYKQRAIEWKKSNPGRELELKRGYEERHGFPGRERVRRYKREHPTKRSKAADQAHNARRRARKRDLPNSITKEDIRYATEYFGNRCAVCGLGLDSPLLPNTTGAMDHWIPLSYTGVDNPGTVAWNMVPLCHGDYGCNNSKGGTMPYDWLIKRYGERRGTTIERRINRFLREVKRRKSQ